MWNGCLVAIWESPCPALALPLKVASSKQAGRDAAVTALLTALQPSLKPTPGSVQLPNATPRPGSVRQHILHFSGQRGKYLLITQSLYSLLEILVLAVWVFCRNKSRGWQTNNLPPLKYLQKVQIRTPSYDQIHFFPAKKPQAYAMEMSHSWKQGAAFFWRVCPGREHRHTLQSSGTHLPWQQGPGKLCQAFHLLTFQALSRRKKQPVKKGRKPSCL